MSTLRVDSITSRAGGTAPSFPNGVQVTGVATATKFVGDASGLYNIPAAGNAAAYADVAGVSTITNGLAWNMYGATVGIITAAGLVATGSTGFEGVWGGEPIGTTRGGTGQNTYTSGDILYASASNTLSKLTVGSEGQVLTISSGLPSWQTSSGGGGGSGAGLGLFNTGITTCVGYTITNSLAAGLTLPSTAGLKHIIHSIQITNIDPNGATINLTSDITGTDYSNINLAYEIPIPGGAGLELLQRPKVLNPSNALRFQGSSNGALSALITYETSTETEYFGKGIVLSSTNITDLHQATGDAVIESILVSNIHGTSDGKITIEWTDSNDTRKGYYCSEVIIPADSTVEILEAIKYLPRNDKIRVTANVANRLEVTIAGKNKS